MRPSIRVCKEHEIRACSTEGEQDVGNDIEFFADPDGWAQTMLGNGTEQGYIDTMQATANTGILIAMFAAVLVTATISAIVGSRMLIKQFEKAGITA